MQGHRQCIANKSSALDQLGSLPILFPDDNKAAVAASLGQFGLPVHVRPQVRFFYDLLFVFVTASANFGDFEGHMLVRRILAQREYGILAAGYCC